MQSIYEKAMGTDFQKLHPLLQERYRLIEGKRFIGEGIMKEISGGHRFLKPLFHIGTKFNLFFPERGNDVPFKIENLVRERGGKEIVEWNRSFYIRKKLRKFNAIMFLENGEVIDYFGEPAVLVSSLDFGADSHGCMHISSRKQWLRVGVFRVPLPRFLYGTASIKESYDEEQSLFRIEVSVKNPLLGQLFFYEGTFRERSEINDD
ncbi:DUF4166 domain-containing protein [Bacillus salacetis]|uniref:DUF4166 domain-containing protein n=1 Tax=Bacillus salacetis TaxID=2315464 RepID=UPI003BA08215